VPPVVRPEHAGHQRSMICQGCYNRKLMVSVFPSEHNRCKTLRVAGFGLRNKATFAHDSHSWKWRHARVSGQNKGEEPLGGSDPRMLACKESDFQPIGPPLGGPNRFVLALGAGDGIRTRESLLGNRATLRSAAPLAFP
jgi:hypothetical protein